jgi:hypothetical protein
MANVLYFYMGKCKVTTVKLRTSKNFWPDCPWASGKISYFHTPGGTLIEINSGNRRLR